MENSENAKTVIAEDVEIVGSIKSSSDIRISGKLNGDLTCNGSAVIGEAAAIKGNISAGSTTIFGQVNGNVNVKDRIEMKSSARVNGDIRAKRLTVEDGVTFVGKSEVNPSGPPASRQGAPADAKAQKPDAAGTTGKVDTSENAEEGKGKSGVFGRK